MFISSIILYLLYLLWSDSECSSHYWLLYLIASTSLLMPYKPVFLPQIIRPNLRRGAIAPAASSYLLLSPSTSRAPLGFISPSSKSIISWHDLSAMFPSYNAGMDDRRHRRSRTEYSEVRMRMVRVAMTVDWEVEKWLGHEGQILWRGQWMRRMTGLCIRKIRKILMRLNPLISWISPPSLLSCLFFAWRIYE